MDKKTIKENKRAIYWWKMLNYQQITSKKSYIKNKEVDLDE